MTNHPRTSRHVAVIGAGASGLVAARELLREGHSVVAFEREDGIGGTWVYTPEVESDPLGLDPSRSFVHSSMYESLRTNLPREVMGFSDYPFTTRQDPRRFPGHKEVLKYLRDFAKEFGIEEVVRLETEVVSVSLAMSESESQWIVKSKNRGHLVGVEEVFDAVVVCVGHFSEPRVADIPGVGCWPGKQIHSHNYRTPEPFRDQVVVVIGISASAVDISRDICGLAKEVHIAARSITREAIGKFPGNDNIWIHSMIKSVHDNGRVIFEDECVVFADTILHCTGYKFYFPFLETNGRVSVDDNRVGPLYKHVFPPALAPWLSFVGLPIKTFPFPMFELQSKWIAKVLSSRVELPSKEKMTEDITSFYSMLELNDVPKRYTHDLFRRPIEYEDWLADQCGCPGPVEWQKLMHSRIFKRILKSPTYRDDNDDEDLILLAEEYFKKYLPNCSENE